MTYLFPWFQPIPGFRFILDSMQLVQTVTDQIMMSVDLRVDTAGRNTIVLDPSDNRNCALCRRSCVEDSLCWRRILILVVMLRQKKEQESKVPRKCQKVRGNAQ
ncbi:unnamed protein product [Amoebophrya sp. A25]|nr:unnamed protein product [Amoebophrya sp. A25]|eukprot:GSA25T00021624001.1